MSVLAVSLSVFVFSSAARADYLEVRRDAWLRKAATNRAEQLEKLAPGTLVALASEKQENAYYKVKTREGKRGFVYRTLVRRHAGALPRNARSAPGHGASAALASGQMRAHLIDVGQGAATLFEFSCGAVLVDTGGETNASFSSADAIRDYLDAFFDERQDLNRTLELVVLTHAHKDHTDNAKLIGEEYLVKNVVTNAATRGSGIHRQNWLRTHVPASHLETVKAGGVPKGGRTNAVIDPVQCADEDPKLKVLWGTLSQRPAEWTNKEFTSDNNHSVAIRIDFGRSSFLVTGDLEERGIDALLKKHSGSTALDIDVWQVSHHGSHNGATKPLTDALTPVIALLATGPEDRRIEPMSAWAFGHPREPVIELLLSAVSRTRENVTRKVAKGVRNFENRRIDKAIYATGWDGSVVITADRRGGYEVRTER